jgi:hypothetical protein
LIMRLAWREGHRDIHLLEAGDGPDRGQGLYEIWRSVRGEAQGLAITSTHRVRVRRSSRVRGVSFARRSQSSTASTSRSSCTARMGGLAPPLQRLFATSRRWISNSFFFVVREGTNFMDALADSVWGAPPLNGPNHR